MSGLPLFSPLNLSVRAAEPDLPASELTLGPITLAADYSEVGDAAGSTSTSYSLSVGDSFSGSVSSGSDDDWVAVDLTAGESYVFFVYGTGGNVAGLDDTVLTLYGAGGSQITQNDDIASGNQFSLIEYTATSTGTYYLGVESYGSETGSYTLETATDTFTAAQVGTYISRFDWGIPTPIGFDVSPGGSLSVNIQGLTSAGQQLALWALESWGIALGITFNTTTSASADIVFDDNQSGAFAGPASYFPSTGEIVQSTVNVGTGWLDTYGTTIDSYSFQTYLHEIGHALGLGHAGPYNGTATYGVDNVYLNDSTQITLMSYFFPDENTAINGSRVTTISPMDGDLEAVHSVYGTPSAYTGNTIWGANSNVGGWLGDVFGSFFDGVAAGASTYQGGAIGFTIFDTGGIDMIDLSSESTAQRVDMRGGMVSDVGGFIGNMVISQDSVIENAIGGSGNDTITGNAANNTIDGGAGSDTVILNVTQASVVATQNGSVITIVSGEGTDQFTNVEFFQFTDGTVSAADLISGGGGGGSTTPTEGDDILTGTPGDDTIAGLGGNDTINGLAGNDALWGQAGNDTIYGGDGADNIGASTGFDTVYGGNGNDNIGGGADDDILYGGNGNDNIGGGADDDILYGDAGNDTMGGGLGNDTMDGGADDDIVNGGAGDDTMTGGTGNDTMGASFGVDIVYGGDGDDNIGGGAGQDLIYAEDGNDAVGGGEANDVIYGGAGHDFLAGGGRDDFIDGGSGDDRINGGDGDDTMTGGTGADVFIFNGFNSGDADVITDFEVGVDSFRMSGVTNAAGSGLQGYVDALNITAVSGGVQMTYQGHTIELQGVSVGDLGVDDFVFI